MKPFTIEDRQKRELEKPLKVYLCGSNERKNKKQNEIRNLSWLWVGVCGRVERKKIVKAGD